MSSDNTLRSRARAREEGAWHRNGVRGARVGSGEDVNERERLQKYVTEEAAAIGELKLLVGSASGGELDMSAESLGALDAFVTNLTSRPGWHTWEVFERFGDIRAWLAARLAYYIGGYARREYGAEWYMSADGGSQASRMPVMAVDGIEFCPLEVAWAMLQRERTGGMVGFFADLERQRFRRPI
jgi:hypothetical protein